MSSPAPPPSVAGLVSVPSTTIGADVETAVGVDVVDAVTVDVMAVSMAVDLLVTAAVVHFASRF